MMRKIYYAITLLFLSLTTVAQFAPGNLALLQVDASDSNTTGSVIEINSSTANQAAVSTVAISGTGANALRFSGSATSTGYVANSNDGSLLCFMGANSTNTSANVNTLNPRAVGTLNAAQSFNLPTTYTGTSGNQTRAATTVDNTNWFLSDQGGLYSNGTSAPSPVGNFRNVRAYGGVVYISTASSSATVIQVNTISATTGGTLTALPGLTNNSNLQDFYLVSSANNGTYDILYVLSATSNTVGTIAKYSLVGGNWTSNGTYATTFGGFGLAAQTNAGGANLFVSTGQGALVANSIIKLTDAAGYNTAIAITTGNNVTLFTAASGKIIKGLAFAPVASTTASVSSTPSGFVFANTVVSSFSASQSFVLTAANLAPASGVLNVTAPNNNFQVSNDGNTWSNTATIAYSNGGTTIGNLQVRFSPQVSGLSSGNVSIAGGGLVTPATIAVSGTGTNSLSLTFSATTTTALNPPYVSATINDSGDPAQQQGIVVDVKDIAINIPAADYTLTASSSNTTVLPNANIAITKIDGRATIKLSAAAVGYANITLTLTKGAATATLVINYAASQSSSSATDVHWHTGNSDASAAIAIDDNFMIIADDEKNILSIFNRNQSGLPVKTFDFNQANILGLTDGSIGAWAEVDVEAAVVSPTVAGKSYWLGSMSNSNNANLKPNRNRLFAITQTGTGAATNLANAGFYNNLRTQLISWGDANNYNFTASAANGHDPKLIDGFNVEGMVFGSDNSTMFIGFRAPLVPTGNRTKAVIAPIQNFEAWFNNGNPAGNPTIGGPIELDLGGRGIRDIIRLSNGVYIIIAGRYDEVLVPAVYTWTGVATDAPLLNTFDVTGLNVEAAMQVNQGGSLVPNKLQIITDNGDNIYYNDAVAAKDLPQDNFKKFRSGVIVSSSIVPVEFVYFNTSVQSRNVNLQWEIAQTDQLRSFEILRSDNGRDFNSIAVVNATQGKFTYSLDDNNVTGSKVYYRIKAVELTNRIYYSTTRAVNFQSNPELVSLYPNTVTADVFSISSSQSGDKVVEIFAATGALYKAYHFTSQAKDISTKSWAKGYYFVRVTLKDGQTITKKMSVQ